MTTLDELRQSMLTPGTTNPFAASYIQLCNASYKLHIDDIKAAVKAIPPLNPGGAWHCTWGPATNLDQANLAFVATYFYGPNLPVFAAVTVRGTDAEIKDGWGIIEQFWEDLDVTSQRALPWAPNDPARVAQGTLDGLGKIQQLSFGGQSLLAYLTGFLGNPANNKPVLVITGHSLGGCLTTVVAPWLKYALAQSGISVPIVPCSFAAPTAGDAAFTAYYQNNFSYSLRYHNSLDVAPLAWSNLSAADFIYDPYGVSVPDLVYLGIVGFEWAMSETGVSYAQPAPSSALAGQFAANLSWYDEAFLQHHATTYMSLLGVTSVTPSPLPRTPVKREPRTALRGRLGPVAALLAKMRQA